MIHNMMLASEPFENIFNGTKTVEYRLYDEKRKKISVGDTIVFTNRDTGNTLKVSVTYIKLFSSFLDLFSALGCEGEPYRRWSPEQLAESMREYYTSDQEKEHGTVAIGIRLVGPELHVIARVKNDFPTKFGLPRQGGLVDEIKGTIKFLPEYRVKEALKGLNGYSHIWVIWGFSLAEREDWSPTVRPPRLGGNTRMGVFATRSPYRPNSIGMSCLKLLKIDAENGELYVAGMDMCDGTPVYDIKPYLAFTDSKPDAVSGFADEKKDYSVKVVIPKELEDKLTEEKLEGLMGALRDDPRPAYKREEEKEYGFAYAGKEIKFVYKDGALVVTEII